MSQIVDSYSESNYNVDTDVGAEPNFSTEFAQSFTGDGGVLNSTKFYLKRVGSPTGSVYAKIYAHSGTFGTSSIPTGAALAISDAVDISTLSTSYALVTFIFSGANKIFLESGTKYELAIVYSGGGVGNNLGLGYDEINLTHGGNASYLYTGTWDAYSYNDLCFYVYKDDPPPPRMGFTNFQNPGIA